MTALEVVPPPPPTPEPRRPRDEVLIAAAGRYKALKKIADGGTAEIFLGEMVGSSGYRRLVAIKRMHAALAGKPEHARMLVEEANVASQLSHGNLVEVRDLGESHGRHFLVLELVDGWSLATLLERGRAAKVPMPPRVAVHIAAEVCRGLAYLHDRGIIHSDVCPHNILIAETGEVKLTDFGIARTPVRAPPTGVIAGKPSYMSPEQARGESLDGRSDLFSLGTVLYYALTDALPFKGKNEEELMVRVASGEFVSPMKRRPSLPKELGQLLLAAMRPAPWARYQTARELLAALELVLRASGRSELERYIAQLYATDQQVPPTRLSSTPVVPLKVVRTPATRPLVSLRKPRRALWAALAAAGVALTADRAWEWIGSANASTAHAAVSQVVSFEPDEPLAANAGAAARMPAVQLGPIEVLVEEEEAPQVKVEPAPLEVSGRVEGMYDQDRVMVTLDTVPRGAEVMVDQRVLGTTPVKLRFRTGIPFEVTFLREGNAPLKKWMTVERPKSGTPRVSFEEPKPKVTE